MAWRNNKDWGKHIPEVGEDVRKTFQERIDNGTCYVSLTTFDQDTRLYGIEPLCPGDIDPIQEEFWRDMGEMYTLCGVGVALHDEKDVLLVRPVYDALSEPWNVPLVDLCFTSDDVVKKVQDTIAEKERLARLHSDIMGLSRTFTEYSSRAVNEAKNVLASLPQLAELAYVSKLTPVQNISPSAVTTLMEFWDKVEVLPVDVHSDWCPVLRVTKNDLIMKFNGETFTRIHKSTDGMSVSLGKMCVEIALAQLGGVANIKRWVMDYNVYGTPKSGYMHPHIQGRDRLHEASGLYEGSVCTGTYESAIKDMCARFDAVGMVHMWRDFLTSCSEGGWYVDFFAWLPVEISSKYCKCHRHLWEEKDVSCPLCGHTKGRA